MSLSGVKRFVKNNKVLAPIAYKVKGKMEENTAAEKTVDVNIPEVMPISARRDDSYSGSLRINIICPSVDKKHVFGGIATALDFFKKLGAACKADLRIIVTDAQVDRANMISLPEYEVIDCEAVSSASHQIVPFASRYNKTIPVAANDVFVCTGWWTVVNIYDTLKWQAKTYAIEEKPIIYLIQDYEPGFYAWSSRYMMADSTYRFDIKTIAVFNSKLLKDYFDENGYTFYKSFCFDPIINAGLKKYIQSYNGGIERKKQIIIYGRPSVARNAFELIIAALKEWSLKYEKASEWRVISAGENFKDIDLYNGMKVSSLGKLSIEDYAKTMLETSVGISLMVSPHPSYPPLEMSTFGIKTITNCYGSKDLSSFNENIVSLKNCSTNTLCETLMKLCDGYSKEGGAVKTDTEYFEREDIFTEIIEEIKKLL